MIKDSYHCRPVSPLLRRLLPDKVEEVRAVAEVERWRGAVDDVVGVDGAHQGGLGPHAAAAAEGEQGLAAGAQQQPAQGGGREGHGLEKAVKG